MTATALSIHDEARALARDAFSNSQHFASLPTDEQASLYRDTYESFKKELERKRRNPFAMGMDEPQKADDLIDDKRHLNQRIDQLGDIASDFVEAVDFPKFVRDLLKGVFDANLEVTLKQMEAYTNLMKAATASIAKFVNAIDNTAAFGYLAENHGDDFSIDFSDDDADKSSANPQGMVLTDKEGNRVDIGDNEVKAKIMDAKIAMAKEQRALLRETILMGITRLVVEKGNVKAGVVFDFKATEKINKADKAALKKASSDSQSITASGGIFGSLVPGVTGGGTRSHQESQITVASAKSVSETSLAAKLTGSVDITFKSDYFKLDNFAAMYGPQLAPPPAPGAAPAAGALPAAPAAPAAPARA
jgi:hypothetical protein